MSESTDKKIIDIVQPKPDSKPGSVNDAETLRKENYQKRAKERALPPLKG